MIAKEEIRKLPMQEKLALLEAVWAEISPQPDELEVPQWHKDLLDERRDAYERGEIRVIDWEDAKKEIEASIR
jgi:putative addiction module component (TIGR02574 family)